MNKKILIISPHYPPSNLAAVHRTRLFSKYLPHYGWDPYILTVHEKYYEEKLDYNLVRLLSKDQHIEKVKAFKVTSPRIIGDIGLRAFFQLRKKALEMIRQFNIDFIYIPIPSFYISLLGPYLRKKTGVAYGIDYIDPWVHNFPGSENKFSRHWITTQLAKFLEPIAVRDASLITGVAEGYYRDVLHRNQHLEETCIFGAMPYGGEPDDHVAVEHMKLQPYLFNVNKSKLQFVYAGAMLPKAYPILEKILNIISSERNLFRNVEFHFIGTGKTPDDPEGYNVRPIAEKYGLWRTAIFEYPKRIPYLDVLTHLEASEAIFILGSTESHYSPSKVYQAILARKPIWAILHKDSTAAQVIDKTHSGIACKFDPDEMTKLNISIMDSFNEFRKFCTHFHKPILNNEILGSYSARAVTGRLVELLDKVMMQKID